jgi:hypothetical protein
MLVLATSTTISPPPCQPLLVATAGIGAAGRRLQELDRRPGLGATLLPN